LAILLIGWLAMRDLPAGDAVVQTFQGTSVLTTAPVTVQDHWEIKWDCPDALDIVVLAADGSVVAEASSAQGGFLKLPKGGTYTLAVSRSPELTLVREWKITVLQSAPVPATIATNVSPSAPPVPPPAPAPATKPAPSNAATPATATALTEAQAHAVVVIKGDVAEGTGFLVHGPDGPAVVTNIHVLSSNPNVKIYTTSGAQITTTSLKGASDRDLAMISIQDNHYTYLDLATDIPGTVQNGDEVITPGNSEGGEVVLDTKGTVLGVGPQRIEFSNPIYHGNSGGPVFHTKSGKVIAVVTQGIKVHAQDDLDKASMASKDSAITGTMRYFGMRLDTVPQWQSYDWTQFLNETSFIDNFHDLSRCLDSFLNGARYDKNHLATGEEYGPPTALYYVKNAKLVQAHDNYHRLTADADQSQRLDATREMVMDLQGIAATNMDAIQNPSNFYAFDQIRVQQEIKYRQALEKEIENFADRISDMGH